MAAPVKAKKKKKAAAANAPAEAVEEVPAIVAEGGKKKKKKRKLAEAEAATPEPAPASAAEAAPAKKKRKKLRTLDDADADAEPAKPELEELFPKKGSASAKAKDAEDFTVFVDGVPYAWTVSKVEDHFRECGEIKEVKAPTWQDSGRLRGFAHVTFVTKAGRDKALAMDGTKVDNKGRYLKIETAKAPSTADGPDLAEIKGKRRLFVKNLPYDATEAAIGELFKKCGKIVEVRVPTSFGRAKGFAYVEFAKSEYLEAAITMKPPPNLQGRVLRLDVDSGSGPKAGFHYRAEAFDSSFGPKRGGDKGGGKGGKDGGKGKGKGKGRGKGMPKKLSLF